MAGRIDHSSPMPRQKTQSDDDVLIQARRLFAEGGGRALSFGALSRATGLAASTLAQRFATIEGLQAAAACAGWRAVIAATDAADHAAADKGPKGWLKALDAEAAEALRLMVLGEHSPEATVLAQDWHARVEGGLARRIGQGDKARSAAQALFLTWQGQVLWAHALGRDRQVKIKDLARRLS